MFDKLYLSQTRAVPYEKEVHEYRAPTDESIKLFGEYQEKAKKSIVDQLHVQNSLFESKGVVFENLGSQSYCFWFKFKLNNKEYSKKIEIPYYDATVRSTLIDEIYKEVSRIVTGHILDNIRNYDI